MYSGSFTRSIWVVASVALLAGCVNEDRGRTPLSLRDKIERAERLDLESVDIDDFEAWAEGVGRALHSEVLLPAPERWFADHFEPETASRLANEYAVSTQENNNLMEFFEKAKDEGKTEVVVNRYSEPIDMQATGLQNAALQQMTDVTPLYELLLVAPGEELGVRLGLSPMWMGNFVWWGD